MNSRIRMLVVAVVAPFIIAVASLGVMLAAAPTLPDPIATHWDASGAANGFGPLWAIAILPLVVVLGYSILAIAVVRAAASRVSIIHKVLLVTAPFLAGMLAVTTTGSVLIQRGLESASDAPSVVPVVLAALAVAAALAIVAWFVLPRHSPPAALDSAELPTVDLAADARGTFMQHVEPSRAVGTVVIVALAVLLVVGSVSLWLAAPLALFVTYVIVMVALAALIIASLFWRVTVDRRGVRTVSMLGWPRFVYPLAEVESANAVTVNPLGDFGGWGLRWAGRWGVILRTGEALQIERTNGRSFVVTVAGARTAAALLNALTNRVQ